jgi:hypothetical protein
VKKINLKKIEKADKPVFDKFYKNANCESSNYTFTNLFMWRKLCNIRWAVEDDVLFTFAENDKTFSAWQPFGAPEKMQNAIAKILTCARELKGDKAFNFNVLEKKFVEELNKFPDAKFEIGFNPAYTDYVYSAEDLATLGGRKLHSKKNHLNQFYNDYPIAKYAPITDGIISKCLELLDDWYETQLNDPEFLSLRENLAHEKKAIHEIFNDFDYFKVKGGAILLGKNVVAFTFGEMLNSDTAVIHVEKAAADIRGAFTAINQNFVAHEFQNATFINREEDMGIDGLRKAKESYRPVKMIKKFSAKIIE